MATFIAIAAALWFLNRRQVSTPPPTHDELTPAPHAAVLEAVPGTTDIRYGPEIANQRANDIRFREGWWIRSLQHP